MFRLLASTVALVGCSSEIPWCLEVNLLEHPYEVHPWPEVPRFFGGLGFRVYGKGLGFGVVGLRLKVAMLSVLDVER